MFCLFGGVISIYHGDECKHALPSEVVPSQSSGNFVETLDAHGGSMDRYILEVDGHVPDPWHNAGRDLLNSNQKPHFFKCISLGGSRVEPGREKA